MSTPQPPLCRDNKSQTFHAAYTISGDRSKHVGVQRVREYVHHDEMSVNWDSTKETLADGFTKILKMPARADLRDML